MNRHFSLYLDLLRLLAALAVLLSHANMRSLVETSLLPQSFGHNAVIVFFLLSGYVIAYVADTKENTARTYWISRLARIYSVALPATLLAPIMDWAGSQFAPAFYAGDVTTHDYGLIRIAASLTFTNELWLISIMPFSNSAYWSLCYEMAYYLLFSIWSFAPAHRRWPWLGLAALVIGPKILLLAPIWLLGVVLYHWRAGHRIAKTAGWLLWLGSLAGILAYQWWDIGKILSKHTEQWLGTWLYTRLHFSKHFLGDYLLALIISASFLGFRAIADQFAGCFKYAGGAIRQASSYTFSIYLFHLPILFFWHMAIPGDRRHITYYLMIVFITLVCTILLGRVTEQQKDQLKKWLNAYLPLQTNPVAQQNAP
ncbi:peptidoglycan/LPS O-acetylase OafA/YrhL [Chitinivorax tropicus]|uniref:Peptidoglycan/LPS O-acetylase OafA/YrhL n=1 Tax=Chitinivorax tropicus TaxID=714531 RepID=A0A840MKQ2_9PROT|nr:acyltransferase [Chitinivorax tropicus]MBB5019754.1 peptidoglycan/LPS O-acetylase OafA/YrhL [Chitinivorax tropicus]